MERASEATPAAGEAQEQLRLIGVISRDLDRARLRYWLIGGWAVDFHLGRVSRPHSDIDFGLDHEDHDRFAAIVARHGFTALPSESPDAVVEYAGPGGHLEVTFLAADDRGRVVTPGFEHWPYPDGAFGTERVEFRGTTAPVMSIAALIDSKQRWQHEIGEPPRPHDLADIAALNALVATRRTAGGGSSAAPSH